MSTSETKTSETKKVTLVSSDGQTYKVEETVAVLSQTIKNLIEDDCADTAIPLPNVTGVTLARVIEYCSKHVNDGSDEKNESKAELKQWDAEFAKVNQDALFDLMLTANYLNIKDLLDLTCQTAADMIKYESVEKVREIFKIVNDFTPEEEAELREENKWAFE